MAERRIESLLIASEGSEVAGRLWPTPAASDNITESERSEAQRQHKRTIETVLASERVDVIHFHGLDFGAYVPDTNSPKVATLHLPLPWYQAGSLEGRDVHLVAVSDSQAASATAVAIDRVVRNGIDTSKHVPSNVERSSLLWLGRVCPEKGTHLAIQVARQLDLPLIVAGPVHPFAFHRNYFETEVRPLLDSRRIYVGPVRLEEKARLLGSARALLIPSLAAETSSLVAMEAASSGTPVVAFRSGALPEVVQHELTGFIVDDAQGMADAAMRSDAIQTSICREYALQNFSFERMVDGYIKLYAELVGE